MPPKKKQQHKIQAYVHDKDKRKNNPPVGLVQPETDPPTDEKQTYQYDPHLDPQLQWSGKTEHTSFEVPTVSLHVHERIDPRTIIEAVRKCNGDSAKQRRLFDDEANVPLRDAIEFYKHARDWSNRLIAGDSLLVMNSLLQKENMAGKVQCVYIDPPYGIKYGSNFQPFMHNRDVKDGDDDSLTAEPEVIKAFRDTWQLGIHSYLSYMRDRLILAKELLSDSGSCFVQIGNENVHRTSLVMDDIFGSANRIATISFATTSSRASNTLPEVADYLLWYAKDKEQIKYRQLYEKLTRSEIIDFFSSYVSVELSDGTCRKPTKEERFDPDKYLPKGSRIYRSCGLYSQGTSNPNRTKPYHWNGNTYHCTPNSSWRLSNEGIDKLSDLERLEGQNSLRWKQYEDEVPGKKISNLWSAQMYPNEKRYVVETATKAISRCILMTTDPGDLVFDPTCGSGTTAHVAEQWGRRWITCDTSRVALALAKQRLMTATFDYYKLKHPDEGISSGLDCRSIKKVSAAILAGSSPASEIYLYDQPAKDTKKARVTGPFTVEAVPAPIVLPIDDLPKPEPLPADTTVGRSGATLRHDEWRDELLKMGIRGKSGQRISFSRIEPFPGKWLHADAETKPDDSGADDISEITPPAYEPIRRVVISFGPEHGLLERRQVEAALQEANTLKPSPQIVVFAAFQFDPEAAKDIDETNWPNVTILKVLMNDDLQTKDLKKKDRTSDSFWLVGQPDVQVIQIRKGDLIGQWQVKVRGFDYFNTKTGQLESGDENKIAVWMLDTDYDGRSLYPRQVFFPMAGSKDGWDKLAKNLKAEIDEGLIECYKGTFSLPFELGEHRRIAVKIVDDRGIESLKIIDMTAEEPK